MHDFEMHRDHEPPEEGDELKFFDVSCVQFFDDVSDAALVQMLARTPPRNQVAVAWLHSKHTTCCVTYGW